MIGNKRFNFLYIPVFSLLLTLPLAAQTLDQTLKTIEFADGQTDFITQRELDRRTTELNQIEQAQGAPSTSRETILDMMVSEKIIVHAVEAALENQEITVTNNEISNAVDQQRALFSQQMGRQLNNDEFYQLVSQQTGMNRQDFQQNVKMKLAQEKYLLLVKGADIESYFSEPTQSEIRQFYNRNIQRFAVPELVNVAYILIATANFSDERKEQARRTANDIRNQARNGGSFETIIQNYSGDSSINYRTTYLLYGDQQLIQTIGQTASDSIFSASIGDTLGVFESPQGFHIFKILQRNEAGTIGLQDVVPGAGMTAEQQIKMVLMQQKQQIAIARALEEMVTELRRDVTVR